MTDELLLKILEQLTGICNGITILAITIPVFSIVAIMVSGCYKHDKD